MKWIGLFLAVALFATDRLPAQQPLPPARASLPITIALKGFWYHPDLGTLNDAYRVLEDAKGLQPWSHDRIDYAVVLEGRYRVAKNQEAILEAGGTGLYRARTDDHAYHTVWRAGAGYRINEQVSALNVYGQATAGILWASFSRTYQSQDVIINTAKTTWYGSVGAGVGYPLTSRFEAEFGIQVLLVPKIHVTVPPADVRLNGAAVSLGIAMQLF